MAARYTYEEYYELSKNLTGSLVALDMDGKNYGVGIIISHRRWYGHFHVYVHWMSSPYINYKLERTVGWHEFERLVILSKPS